MILMTSIPYMFKRRLRHSFPLQWWSHQWPTTYRQAYLLHSAHSPSTLSGQDPVTLGVDVAEAQNFTLLAEVDPCDSVCVT